MATGKQVTQHFKDCSAVILDMTLPMTVLCSLVIMGALYSLH